MSEAVSKPEPWWRWRWDTLEVVAPGVVVPLKWTKRWRRGWLTFYYVRMDETVLFVIYLPFNFSIWLGREA